MNEYQQKAEAYVREQLPELMELSFGCEVECNVMGKALRMRVDGCEVEVNGNGVKIDSDCYDFNVKEGKIIGHPIQLQHWLRVLGEIYVSSLLTCMVHKDGIFTLLGLQFNLTTGQPATEEDYKAFCEIVGV